MALLELFQLYSTYELKRDCGDRPYNFSGLRKSYAASYVTPMEKKRFILLASEACGEKKHRNKNQTTFLGINK